MRKFILFSMHPFKAPGPDGLKAVFFQKFWPITFMIKNAFSTGAFPKDLKMTNLCLIPKAPKPDYITQFRPIGLCNVVYKIFT